MNEREPLKLKQTLLERTEEEFRADCCRAWGTLLERMAEGRGLENWRELYWDDETDTIRRRLQMQGEMNWGLALAEAWQNLDRPAPPPPRGELILPKVFRPEPNASAAPVLASGFLAAGAAAGCLTLAAGGRNRISRSARAILTAGGSALAALSFRQLAKTFDGGSDAETGGGRGRVSLRQRAEDAVKAGEASWNAAYQAYLSARWDAAFPPFET